MVLKSYDICLDCVIGFHWKNYSIHANYPLYFKEENKRVKTMKMSKLKIGYECQIAFY